MASYIVVQGWLTITEKQVNAIKAIISGRKKYIEQYDMEEIFHQIYSAGWCFSSSEINGKFFVFYGAPIKGYYIDWFKDTLIEISQKRKDTEGSFFFDNEGHFYYRWDIKNGTITETTFNPKQVI